MPFLLSLFVFLCGTSWFVFGLLGRDPFIAVRFLSLWWGGGGDWLMIWLRFPHGVWRQQKKSKQSKRPPSPAVSLPATREPKADDLCSSWQVPNGFGCGLGAMQLVLYAIYRNSEASRGQKDGDGGKDGSALEMGYEKPQLANGGAQNGTGGPAL